MDNESNAGSEYSTAGTPAVSHDGVVFLRVRSCTACGVKNTERNEITAATLFGQEKSPYTVWNRGTSLDPRTNHCKICELTFVQGGFNAADSQTITFEDFSEKLKQSTDLHEFKGARSEMVKLLNEGVVRFRSSDKTGRIQAAAKRSLQAFRQNQVELVSRFKAIDKEKYEKQYPGRIQKENLKTTTKMVDGERKEVVLIRKDPEGEWDVNVRDISGTVQEEELDNQQTVVRANQMALKQEHARKRFKSLWQEQANAASALQPQNSDKDGEPEKEPAETELSEEEEMPARSLLEEVEEADLGTPRLSAKPPPTSPKAKSKHNNQKPAKGNKQTNTALNNVAEKPEVGVPVAPGAMPPPAGGMPPPPAVSKTKKDAAASKHNSQETADATTAPEGNTGRGRPSKFKGKSPHEVLEKHGLSELEPVLEKTQLGHKAGKK